MNLSTRWLIDGIRGEGGEAEIDPESRTVSLLVDPALAATLGLAEFSRFSLDPGAGADPPCYNRELIEKCASLWEGRGAAAVGVYDPGPAVSWPSATKAESFLRLARGKSAFRELRLAEQTYIVAYARYSAVSDEKREAIVSAAVNLASGTVAAGLGSHLEALLEDSRIESAREQLPVPSPVVFRAIEGVLRRETEMHLREFGESISRRLGRDCDRIYGYYKELMEGAVADSAGRKNTLSEKTVRLETIRQECARKIDDLRIKYLTRVAITPIALLAVRLPCACAGFTTQMGALQRDISIPWNPVTQRADSTLCERCGHPADVIRLCREFHWLCKACWKRCPECEKEYCPVCKPKGCTHG
jgi:hypothetical protein